MNPIDNAHQHLAYLIGRHYAAGLDLPQDIVDVFLQLREAEEAAWSQPGQQSGTPLFDSSPGREQ